MPTYIRKKIDRVFLLLVGIIVVQPAELYAQEPSTEPKAKADSFFALPLDLDFDFGATNGDATILRIMPLYGFPSRGNWEIVHLNLVTLADAPAGVPGRPGNPEPIPGERATGISDLVHASFFTPITAGKLDWGIGGLFSIPIASDSALGSGKWTAGPSFRVLYQTGQWNLGAFGGQSWSFAGDDNRSDVSQLIVRGTIRRQLPNNWYFVSAPIITANWKTSGERWLVPMGGGFGKVFDVDGDPWALSLQGYYNAIKPEGAPNWVLRLSLIAAIPLGQ